MKQIIYKRQDGYYMTTENNYNSYVQDCRKIKKIEGVNTREEAAEVIEMFCRLYGDRAEDYIIIN